MSVETALSNVERQERMLRFVEQRQRVTVADMCDQFGVSIATARRDLEALAERGSVRRVHGGALVADGETAFLSSGTTTLEVARSLRGQRRLTVITNSLLVLNELADAPEITLVGLGGLLRRSEMSFIGHITAQARAEVRADT